MITTAEETSPSNGTVYQLFGNFPIEVVGKTGTAEFETGKETHAWFTGFAPVESPKIVVTVLVEESGSGGKVAGPIARQLFDIYMSR